MQSTAPKSRFQQRATTGTKTRTGKTRSRRARTRTTTVRRERTATDLWPRSADRSGPLLMLSIGPAPLAARRRWQAGRIKRTALYAPKHDGLARRCEALGVSMADALGAVLMRRAPLV